MDLQRSSCSNPPAVDRTSSTKSGSSEPHPVLNTSRDTASATSLGNLNQLMMGKMSPAVKQKSFLCCSDPFWTFITARSDPEGSKGL